MSHIATGVITIIGVFGMASALAAFSNRRRLAIVVLCLLLAVVSAMLAGSLTRHSMTDRDLYGMNNVSLAPDRKLDEWPGPITHKRHPRKQQ